MEIIKSIQNRIYEIKGVRVMLDFDIAELYEVAVKIINQAVKRNIKRFPDDFMFRLSTQDWKSVQPQIITPADQYFLRSQIVTLENRGRHSKYLPYAFTEQGIAMLSGIQIYNALENLLDKKAAQRKWDERERIGFKM